MRTENAKSVQRGRRSLLTLPRTERGAILHERDTLGKINRLSDVQLKARPKSTHSLDAFELCLAAVLGRPQGIEIPSGASAKSTRRQPAKNLINLETTAEVTRRLFIFELLGLSPDQATRASAHRSPQWCKGRYQIDRQ